MESRVVEARQGQLIAYQVQAPYPANGDNFSEPHVGF